MKTKMLAVFIFGLSMAFFCVATIVRMPERGNDYDQFYSAAKLVGTGHLYDWNAIRDLQVARGGTPVPFERLPVFAIAFKPMTFLPESAGRLTWFGLTLAAALGSLVLLPHSKLADGLAVLFLSYPFLILLSNGQDTMFFLLFAVAGMRLLRSNHEFLAALLLVLCANKFHLAVAIPVFLIATGKWKTLLGGFCGGLILLGISGVVEGWDWPMHLYADTGMSGFSPAPYKMPNLNGIAYWLPWSSAAEVLLAIIVLFSVWVVAKKYPFEVAVPVTLAAGLLLSHHAYVYDAILLIPLLLMIHHTAVPKWLKLWSFVLCFPQVYTSLIEPDTTLVAQIAITGFTLATLAFLVWRARNLARADLASTEGPVDAFLHLMRPQKAVATA